MILHTELSREVELMLGELESFRLVVALVPQRTWTNEGGMVRCVVERNARWYRDFCEAHASSRIRAKSAFDTRIKRRGTVETLKAILNGRSESKYTSHLLAIARRRVANNYRPRAFVKTLMHVI